MNSNRCDVCGEQNAEHNFDIAREGGATPVNTCNTCKKLARRLALVVTEPYCNLTRRQWSTLLDRAGDEPTFGEVVATVEEADMIATNDAEQLVWDALSMLVLDQNMDTKTIVLGEGPVSPDDRREYDRFGNPIPSPTDVCDFCGTLRYDRPEGFSPEIMTPFGEAEYLCKSCREQGRGMK